MISSRMHDSSLGQGGKASSDGQGTRLESWKEIAAYLGRDVTTVQRWERREGLPVHRLLHAKIGSVFAYSAELEAWRQARSHQAGAPMAASAGMTPAPLPAVHCTSCWPTTTATLPTAWPPR